VDKPPGRMDRKEVLELYDEEMRKQISPGPGSRIERAGTIVREIGEHSWIAYSHLESAEAAAAVEREVALFRQLGKEVEWKLHDYDGPPELAALLESAGFAPDPPETLLILDLSNDPIPARTLHGATVERVVDLGGLREAVAVSRSAFAPEPGWDLSDYVGRLGDPTMEVFIARIGGQVVSAGRLELPRGRSFASLWGGGTLPQYRGRGIYRELVWARTAFAKSKGYRYITVDARSSSLPILRQLRFEPLAEVVGWVLRPQSNLELSGRPT
jgi:ribosomal protein S18 acetylase RimI-like enzyme